MFYVHLSHLNKKITYLLAQITVFYLIESIGTKILVWVFFVSNCMAMIA